MLENLYEVSIDDVNCQAADAVARQKLLYEIAERVVHGKVGANGAFLKVGVDSRG